MFRRKCVGWGVLIFLVLAKTFNLSASPAASDLSDRNIEIVKSFHSCIEDIWKGKSEGRGLYDKLSKATVSRREFMQKREKQLRSLPVKELRPLLRDERLDAVDKHLVEISIAFQELPDTFTIIEYYRELSWPRKGPRPRAPRSPDPEERHLHRDYRAAWEWILLRGCFWRLVLPSTAARALAKIGDPQSLELMESTFRWAAESPDEKPYGGRVMRALSLYKQDVLPQALQTAFRCWKHARELAGKPVYKFTAAKGEDVYRTIPEDLPDHLSRDVAQYFAPELIASEAKKAKPDSDYGEFLKKVVALQQKKTQVEPADN